MDVLIVAGRVVVFAVAALVYVLGFSVCRRWPSLVGRDQAAERSRGAELTTAAVFVAVPALLSAVLVGVATVGVSSTAPFAWAVPMTVGLIYAAWSAARKIGADAS